MSRLGKKPIDVPAGVDVSIDKGRVSVKGPLGGLQQTFSNDIHVKFDGDKRQILVESGSEEKETRARHGLYRSLIMNVVDGVSKGFEKKLELQGVGYRVSLQGNRLTFLLGFCHAVEYWVHPQVKVEIDGNTRLKLECIDKQLLGQVSAEIRSLRPPEPYKGKGIRYVGEQVRRKIGKAQAG
ncbi:MAG: 50S ribosomal protein L6 [Planctomycetes bacterium]|nr:50S ribosomal protein L6 [Planctomycetota bacterium]